MAVDQCNMLSIPKPGTKNSHVLVIRVTDTLDVGTSVRLSQASASSNVSKPFPLEPLRPRVLNNQLRRTEPGVSGGVLTAIRNYCHTSILNLYMSVACRDLRRGSPNKSLGLHGQCAPRSIVLAWLLTNLLGPPRNELFGGEHDL